MAGGRQFTEPGKGQHVGVAAAHKDQVFSHNATSRILF
jgi:hypothetical protein